MTENVDFLKRLKSGRDKSLRFWVTGFEQDPRTATGSQWGGHVVRSGRDVPNGQNNAYMSTALFPQDATGRRVEEAREPICVGFDDVALENRDKLPRPPSWVVETSPGNTQVNYRLCRGESLAAAAALLHALTKAGHKVGPDPSGNNVVRYIRLPKGVNTKRHVVEACGEPFPHRLVEEHLEREYTVQELAEAFGVTLEALPTQSRQEWGGVVLTPELEKDLRSALDYLAEHGRSDERDTWVAQGHRLKASFGDEGFALWDEFSRRSPKYKEHDQRRRWDGFRAERAGYEAIFAEAQELGWENPAAGREDDFLDGIQGEGETGEELPEPFNFFESPSPRPMDLNACLPRVIANYADAMATANGHDPGAYALSALVASSGVIQHSVRVRVSLTWDSPILLWGALIGESGSGKSPAMDYAVEPVDQLQREVEATHRARHEAWEQEDGNRAPPPPPPSFYTNNVTIEALQKMAQETPDHHTLYHADEGTAWLNAMGRYLSQGKDSERGEWLRAWMGQPYRCGRITRGRIYIRHYSIALLVGFTADKIQGSTYTEAASDGLLARMLVYQITPTLQVRQDPSLDPTAAREEYWSAVRGIAKERDRVLTLPEDVADFWRQHQQRWKTTGQELQEVVPGLASVLAKAGQNLARVAGLFHLLEDDFDNEISLETMQQAYRFMDHMLHTAYTLHLGLFASDDTMKLAKKAAACILRKTEQGRITRARLIKSKVFDGVPEPRSDAAIRYLRMTGWLIGPSTIRQRRADFRFESATGWIVNPRVFDGRFAQQREEFERRARAVIEQIARWSGQS